MTLFPLSPAQKKRAYEVYAIVILAYMLSFFHRIAPAALATELKTAFSASSAMLGMIAAMYFYVYMVLQIPTGILADTLGPRKVLIWGGLVAGVGSILFGLAPSLWVAALGRALIGIGVAVTFVCMLKLIANWFPPERFATLSGLAILLGNIGAVLSGAPLAQLVEVVSWRDVFVVVGGISIGLGILTAFVGADYPEGHPHPRTQQASDWKADLKTVAKNPAIWSIFFAGAGLAGTFFTFTGLWAAPYLIQAHGHTKASASLHISATLAGFACMAFFIGTLSDRMQKRKPLFLGLGAVYVVAWGILLSGFPLNAPASFVICTLLGVGASSFTLTWAMAKEVSPPANAGMATGLVNSGMFLVTGIMQPTVGAIVDACGGGLVGFQWGLGSVMVLATLGWLMGWTCQETRCVNQWPCTTR